MVVASSIGSGNGSSTWTRLFGSSAQAAAIPRGRPSLMLVPVWCTPWASSAEARVSPGWPVSVRPPKVNRRVVPRSIRPPGGQPVRRRAVLLDLAHGSGRLLLVEAVDTVEAVGDGVADRVEPAAAAEGVHPPLREQTPGVVADEQVLGPLLVRQRAPGPPGRTRAPGRRSGTRPPRAARTTGTRSVARHSSVSLGCGGWPAVDGQAVVVSGRRRRRRARRSGHRSRTAPGRTARRRGAARRGRSCARGRHRCPGSP